MNEPRDDLGDPGDLGEDGIDPRLRAALRHAPDRDLAPPAALDRRILDAASEALRSKRVSARSGWRAWLDALTRPAGAAALTSVVLATVIGVMWQDGPPPEAPPETPSETLSEMKAAPPKAAMTPPAPAGENRTPSEPATAAAVAAAPVATLPPPPAAPLPRPDRSKEALSKEALSKAAPTPAPAPAPAPSLGPALGQAPAEAPASPPPAPPAAPPVASPAPGVAAPSPLSAPPRSDAAEAVVRPRSEVSQSMPRSMPAPAARSADRSLAAAFDPMLAALATTDPGSPDAALLRELQRAMDGRWQAVLPPSRLPTFTTAPLRLPGDAGTLQLEGDEIVWTGPDGTPWSGTLPAGAAPLLRERLAR